MKEIVAPPPGDIKTHVTREDELNDELNMKAGRAHTEIASHYIQHFI